jgi:hypothetical protein
LRNIWHIKYIIDTCQTYGSVLDVSGDSSRLRQQLRSMQQELSRKLEPLIEARGPLIRGTFGTRARVCGKPSCRCAQGELHESKYLTASDGGTTRQVHVPASDEIRVAQGVSRYRRFRNARTQLSKGLTALTRRLLELVDALGHSLLDPYPPDNPLPAPKRRGRPSKGSRRVRR